MKNTLPQWYLYSKHKPSLIMGKISDKSTVGIVCKIPDQYSANYQDHEHKESLSNCHSQDLLRRHDEYMLSWWGVGGFLEWKNGTK